jgi:hypothetical protein
MSYATGYNSLTSLHLLNIHAYIYCRFCRLCVISVWKKKLAQGMVLWRDLVSMAGSNESKPASQEGRASRVFSLLLSPWLWTFFFVKTWAAVFWLATLRWKEVVPSNWSPVCPVSLRPKHVFVFFLSPRSRMLSGTVLSQLFSQPDINEDTPGEAPGGSFATAYFAGSKSAGGRMLCPQYCVLCCLVKVDILRRADLGFTKSCHMSNASLEVGVDAGTRSPFSSRACSS